MKNHLLLLLLCFVTVYCKSVPEPPAVPIGPFDETIDNTASPIGENMTLFQGDIVNSGRTKGSKIGEAGTRTPWPDAVIPYVWDCSTANIKSARDATEAAMKEWESRTCVKFVEKQPHHKEYLEFIRAAGCWATYVGFKKGKKTQVSIGNGCDYKHVMVHELGHVIGFWHEQSRPDRDQYIRIDKGNVIRSLLYNFDIVREQVHNYGEPYDFASIMHYPWNAFALDRRRATIIPLEGKNNDNKRPYIKLSDSDVTQTRRMYKCDEVANARALAKKKIGEANNKVNHASLAGPNCQDAHKNCQLWARHGFCDMAADPLLKICAKSCSNCGPCEDSSQYCAAWANYGFCVTHVKYMWKNCKVSCSICIPAPTTGSKTEATTKKLTTTPKPTTKLAPSTTARPPATKPTTQGRISLPTKKFTGVLCADRSKYCKEWAEDGRCLTDRWVYDNCMRSCKRYTICDREMIKPLGHCTDRLGVYSENIISNGQLYATSVFSPGGGWYAPASSARLYKEDDHRLKRVGAWCANPNTRTQIYLQIDLRQTTWITALATQGRDGYFEHVKSYSLSFSYDGRSWSEYQEGGVKKIFDGNCDHVTPVLNLLESAQSARFVRIYPINYSGAACLRVELYGCKQ